MTDFYRLKECNDFEGETWLYYFPADKKVVNALSIVTSINEDEYEFYKDHITDEGDIDFLVGELRGIGGYKSLVNKVVINPAKIEDLFSLASNIEAGDYDEDEMFEAVSDLLYKGSLFKKYE